MVEKRRYLENWETKNIVKGVQRRYSQKWLDRNNLKYIRVMKGPKKAMQHWERLKLLNILRKGVNYQWKINVGISFIFLR